jgi:hypothetical protein
MNNRNLITLAILALLGGILVALRPVLEVSRKGDGDGHVNIIIQLGFVNVTPVNFTDNTPKHRKKDE